MNRHFFLAICSLFCFNSLFAQLTLQKMNSQKSVTIPLESTIEIKLPTFSSNDSCDCYKSYGGIIKSIKNDTVFMVVNTVKHAYVDSKSISSISYSNFKYLKKDYPTPIHLSNPLSVSIETESRINLKSFAAVIMTLSAGYAIIGSPFVKEKYRKPLGIIALTGFSTGLTIVLSIPDLKTYNLQQPKNKSKKKLWRLVTSQ